MLSRSFIHQKVNETEKRKTTNTSTAIKKPGWTNYEVRKLIEMHNNGYNRYDIALTLNRSLRAVRNQILKRDLRSRVTNRSETGIFTMLGSDPSLTADDIDIILNLKYGGEEIKSKFEDRYVNLAVAFSMQTFDDYRERLGMNELYLNWLINEYKLDNPLYIEYNKALYKDWLNSHNRLVVLKKEEELLYDK